MDDEQGAGDPFVFEIGKLAILAGNVESHVDWILQVLISPAGDGVGYAVAGTHHFARRAELAKRLVPIRLGPETSPAHDLEGQVRAYISDAIAFMKNRNRLLHSIWMIYAVEQTATILRRAATDLETEDVTLETMKGYVAEGEELATRGGHVWQELIGRYGHLDALIAATKELDPDWPEDD